MYKIIALIALSLFLACDVKADAKIYLDKFNIQMDMDLSDLDKYISELKKRGEAYDKGYISRLEMGKKFKTEFSRTIKYYGMTERRLKNDYEDDLLEMINMLPKETYPYIGPMLHEVPGMSEKILNLPGIKETKNKFPEKINEKYQGIENLEFLSPALYVVLMPDFWKKDKKNLDKPQKTHAKNPPRNIELPDYLKGKSEVPLPIAEKNETKETIKLKNNSNSENQRTLYPTLTSPLTTSDAKAFLETIDDIVEWGNINQQKNLTAIVRADILLNLIEGEKGEALIQNSLKDIVNPCQRLVLKTRVAKLENDFAKVVAKKGFTPKEWAYTCDKTVKALRVAETNHSVAYAIRAHRQGYYNNYIKMLPEKWQRAMFETEAAIIAMHAVLVEDVEAIRPIKDKIRNKIVQNDGMILLEPIIY